MAVKAACDVITSCINEKEIKQFENLFPYLLALIPDFVQNQDYDVLSRLLGLFDDLTASDDNAFYLPHLTSILSTCCSVGFGLLDSSSCCVITHFCILYVVLLQMRFPVSFKRMPPLLLLK